MAQTTRIDHGSALATLNEADEHFNSAHQINNSNLDVNTQMTSGAWQGVAAQRHLQAHQQVHDDVHSLINMGKQYIEIARNNINAQAAQDAGN